MKPPTEENVKTTQCFIKPSQSMTSLPPSSNGGISETAKLRIDRPYNSLKKKRNSERDIWRRSWESAHSHSSCSLQSNTTNNGSGTGKDEFWAALQTNYNYIMDTNLLDSCKEARDEIEGNIVPNLKLNDSREKSLSPSSKSYDAEGDPRTLRKWIREMEERISKSPSITEAMKMKVGEIQCRLTEHSILYREIVSKVKVVGACIRQSEELTHNNKSFDEKEKSPSPNNYKSCPVKGLEKRYHLLYLKAIEVQCMLEELFSRKNSPSPISRSSDTDEEPAAKLARLNDIEFNSRLYTDSENLINPSDKLKTTSPSSPIKNHYSEEVCVDVNNQSDDEWVNELTNKSVILLNKSGGSRQNIPNGSDADSEGSDCEIIPVVKINRTKTCGGITQGSISSAPVSPKRSNHNNMEIVNKTKELSKSQIELSITTTKSINSLNISPKIKENISPKRSNKQKDISKFNRSNRKSKNCAIFYFKHLDTDSEQRDLSSQPTSEGEFISENPSSDDEWIYNTNEMNENKENITNGNKMDVEENNVEKILEKETMEVDGNYIIEPKIIESVDIPDFIKDENDENNEQNGSERKSSQKSYKTVVTQYSKETIHQLVLGAETLVREDVKLITQNSQIISLPVNVENDKTNPKIKRVQEWLEHNPLLNEIDLISTSAPTTDCDASGEYTTESDTGARDSDTSEGVANSVTTCLPGGSTSQATSTEIIGGSSEPLLETTITENDGVAPIENPKVIMRTIGRRNSDRPWSVSCISQLTINVNKSRSQDQMNNQGLLSFSISESALHTLSSQKKPQIQNSDSKNSLKKRRNKTRRRVDIRKSDSESDCCAPKCISPIILNKSESFTAQSNIGQDLTVALTKLTITTDDDDCNDLMKPKFCLGGPLTNVLVPGGTVNNLGSLAALSSYNRDEKPESLEQDQNQTGTEEHSSFSEQAWDNYQEKYQSEPYSEGVDLDAERRLLEFGDDYRNFLDSQSDCCSSSISAANNLDSLSPPRHRRMILSNRTPDTQSNENSLRRRRALEHAEEKRRKNMNLKKNSSDERRRSGGDSSGHSNHNRHSPNRKLDFEPHTPSTIKIRRKASESDNSSRKRSLRSGSERVALKFTSSSSSDSDDDIEMRNLLEQSKMRLENTQALRKHSHLLRPEDYAEIIATCRDNVRCLESVLRGVPGTVLTTVRSQHIRELLSSWESLLNWSENASVARKLQEEMTVLKNLLIRLGVNEIGNFDSEEEILFAIEELKKEKLQLQNHRSTMLRLNASVHSWLTRQEMKIQKIMESTSKNNVITIDCNQGNDVDEKNEQFNSDYLDFELHKYLKNEVDEMYSAWDEADLRISNRLEIITSSLQAWKQFESGFIEFQETLVKDKDTLYDIQGALKNGKHGSIEVVREVKEVARLLAEKKENIIYNTQLQNENIHLNPNGLSFNIKTSSNGSLSDSGISDGGCVSDGGLSERERRLSALRKLAKQLENTLAPGSEALKSIAKRMEAAEAELRSLQTTCRELMVRTTGNGKIKNNNQNKTQSDNCKNTTLPVPITNGKGKTKKLSQSKRNNGNTNSLKRRHVTSTSVVQSNQQTGKIPIKSKSSMFSVLSDSDPEPDDPNSGNTDILLNDDDGKTNWVRRITRLAFPVQLAIMTLLCAACLLEPQCCDTMNNFSFSLAPQLRYVRGPPPI